MRSSLPTFHETGRRVRFPQVPAPVLGADPRFDSRAGCGLAVAVLFDERRAHEPTAVYRDRIKEAKLVCAACPVRSPCLEFGVGNQLTAVMGGQELRHGRLMTGLAARGPGWP